MRGAVVLPGSNARLYRYGIASSSRRSVRLQWPLVPRMAQAEQMRRIDMLMALAADDAKAKVSEDQFAFWALRTKVASSPLKRGASSKKGEWPMPW
jgi:hypothetical protein